MYAKQTKFSIFSSFSSLKGSFCHNTLSSYILLLTVCQSFGQSAGTLRKEGHWTPKSCKKPEGWAHFSDNAPKCFCALTLQLHFDLLKEFPWFWLAESLGDSSRFPAAWSKREIVTSLQHNSWNNTVCMENTPSKLNLHSPIVSCTLKTCIHSRSIKSPHVNEFSLEK